ncbi:hypothetical protein B5D77_03135 [Microcystis sp. MC19]|uniref:hypothetical protein n=1 Tax=Microcystis sp. MC19 TaxID=1967666 RepID=UPI000D1351EC|nr:hypothetical protein [Microcystis sp. MC19]AVQ70470.1 hypothetical protein B5D77_03135 [Microcystis sp. MC19]
MVSQLVGGSSEICYKQIAVGTIFAYWLNAMMFVWKRRQNDGYYSLSKFKFKPNDVDKEFFGDRCESTQLYEIEFKARRIS